MLLFNYTPTSAQKFKDKFQNISCYCLTDGEQLAEVPGIIFQNISCYCLTCTIFRRTCRTYISKHLMLLFNIFVRSGIMSLSDFKTSHVIV